MKPTPKLGTAQADLMRTSCPAANNLITQFVTHGVLHEMAGRKRNRRFLYRDYTNLFHDEQEGGGRRGTALSASASSAPSGA